MQAAEDGRADVPGSSSASSSPTGGERETAREAEGKVPSGGVRLGSIYGRSRKSLPGLNRIVLPGGIVTSTPVLGLRPMPRLRRLTWKTPKPRSSIRSPAPRADRIDSITVSTAVAALARGIFARSTTRSTMSALIMAPSGKSRRIISLKRRDLGRPRACYIRSGHEDRSSGVCAPMKTRLAVATLVLAIASGTLGAADLRDTRKAFLRARTAVADGRYREALDLYRKVIELVPQDAVVRF